MNNELSNGMVAIDKDEKVVTSSLVVAETFGKEHYNVLRDIDKLKKDVVSFEEMFVQTNIPDAYGRGRRAYVMTKDGFTLLAMGFTGKKAMQFKLAYMEAFNEMEKRIFELEEQRRSKEGRKLFSERVIELTYEPEDLTMFKAWGVVNKTTSQVLGLPKTLKTAELRELGLHAEKTQEDVLADYQALFQVLRDHSKTTSALYDKYGVERSKKKKTKEELQ